MRKLLFAALALLIALGLQTRTSAQSAAGFQVIVHVDNPVTSMSRDDVSDMLLKKRRAWRHGATVEPVDLEAGSEIRNAFSRGIHGRSVNSIKNYWQRQIFGGHGVPPLETDEAGVLAFVRSRSGGIGYVAEGTALTGVKRVTISE